MTRAAHVAPGPFRSTIVRSRRVDPDVVGGSGSRRSAVAVLVFLATLPLQFQSIAGLALGEVRYFHLAAVVMVLLNPGELRRSIALVREFRVLVVALVALTLIAVCSLAAYGGDVTAPVQHLFYAGVGMVFLLMLRAALREDRGRALLVWAAPITVAVTLVELVRRTAENGLSVEAVLRTTVLQLDPTLLIYGVFRSGTESGEVIQPANIRHEIMAAVVVSVLVTLLAGHVRRSAAVIAGAASLVGAALVVMSLSRAVLLPLMIVVVGCGVRVWLKVVLTRASLLAVLLVTIASPIVGSLLYTRFVDDTGSYEERLGAFSYSAHELLMRVLGGGPALTEVEESTHTLVFDVLFQAGWVAGLAAVVVVGVLLRHTLAAYGRYFRGGAVTDLVAVTAGTMAIVRSFTIGGGYLHQVEWVEIGILLALAAGLAARHPSTGTADVPAQRTGPSQGPVPRTGPVGG